MCSQETLYKILNRFQTRLSALLGASMKEMILFGSYAQNEADDESDVDVMILSDLSREEIASFNWKLGEIASEILLDYGVLISPIIENHLFFEDNMRIIPFFRNVREEGIRINV